MQNKLPLFSGPLPPIFKQVLSCSPTVTRGLHFWARCARLLGSPPQVCTHTAITGNYYWKQPLSGSVCTRHDTNVPSTAAQCPSAGLLTTGVTLLVCFRGGARERSTEGRAGVGVGGSSAASRASCSGRSEPCRPEPWRPVTLEANWPTSVACTPDRIDALASEECSDPPPVMFILGGRHRRCNNNHPMGKPGGCRKRNSPPGEAGVNRRATQATSRTL